MLPRARKDELTVRVLSEETLLYDRRRHKAHCLNAPAALIWRHCDGKNSVRDLARILGEELAVPEPDAVVTLALEQLGRRELLEEPPMPGAAAERIERREALKRLAVAAVTLPLVMTITTRTAAQTISDPSTSDSSSDPPVQVTVQQNSGGSPPPPPPPPPSGTKVPPRAPCRTKGQSCLASKSGQQGTCCAGLTCNGVVGGAGVCGGGG